MKKAIVYRNTLVTIIAILIFTITSMYVTDFFNKNQDKEHIIQITEIYKSKFVFSQDNDYSAFTVLTDELKETTRLTVIGSDGTVYSDSHYVAADMGNHINRPEVKAALEGNSEIFIRKSDTINIDMMYYAVKIFNSDNTDFVILRVAGNINSINSYVYSVLPVIILLIIGVILISIFFTIRLNKNILSAFKFVEENLVKLNDGTYTNVMPRFKHEELNNAVIGLNDIQQKINNNIKRLNEETEKLDYVLYSIEQGIITLDGNLDIILINSYAKRIFKIDNEVTGKNLLYTGCGNQLYNKIAEAIKEKNQTSFEALFNDRIYKISIIIKKDALLILEDITAIKKMENTRSEFFANASHELKTPITSIMGFSELLANDKDNKNHSEYISYILKDSKRMLRLIEDMLKLSKLDTNTQSGSSQTIDLQEIAKEVKQSLSIMAKNKNVTVNINGNAKFYANRDNIYELMENLVSNAIRYNNQNGKVEINLSSQNGKTIIEVEDNGIGIAKIHQDRIFERFYRVDKGRSKDTGGTGLGLSIVKHIVNLYGGSVELVSEIDKGTKITIIM